MGFFVIPIVGVAVGGVAGVYAGELRRAGDRAAAWRTTRATLTGFGVAALVQLAVALAMAAVAIGWVVAN